MDVVIYWSARLGAAIRKLEQQVSVAIILLQGGIIDGEQTRYYLTCKTNKTKKTGEWGPA